jgi:hypothetical protein
LKPDDFNDAEKWSKFIEQLKRGEYDFLAAKQGASPSFVDAQLFGWDSSVGVKTSCRSAEKHWNRG